MPKFHELSLDERKKQIKKMQQSNPEAVPVIIKVDPRSTIPHLSKKRFLIPKNYRLSQLIQNMKTEGKLHSDKALYFFIKNTIVKNDAFFGQLYTDFQSEDGALYLIATNISTFGALTLL